MSDTQSLTSESSGTASNSAFLELEDLGKLTLGEITSTNPIKRFVFFSVNVYFVNSYICQNILKKVTNVRENNTCVIHR